MDNLTVGLYGINGVYNYGCEGIIRGTEIILRKKWPDIHIKYASLRPKDDKKRLSNTNVDIVEREQYPITSIPGVSKFLSYSVGPPFYLPYSENLNWVDECDLILSIGGDIYTLPPNYNDRNVFYFLKYLNNSKDLPPNYKKLFNSYHWLIHFGEAIMKMNKKFVIWGASIGPFEKSVSAKNLFIDHLSKVNLITVREPVTMNYLKNEGLCANVQNCADPAFSIPNYLSKKSNDKLTIGLNLSPLSSLYIYGKTNKENIIYKQSEMISNIIKTFDTDIILLPHVVCDFDHFDDDLRYLLSIQKTLPEDIYERVSIVKNDPGFLGIRKSIIQCDLVLSSRMHCAINALSLGIPVIFIGYSEKSLGMCNYIYGDQKWIIPLKDLHSTKLINMLKSAIKQINSLNKYIKQTKNKWNQETYAPLNYLDDFLHNSK